MSLAIVEASVLACLGRIGSVVFHWCEWAKTNNQKTYEHPIHCPWGMQRKLSTSLNFWFPFASSVVFFGRANWKEQRNNSILDYASTSGVPIFKERSGQWEIALLLLTETPSPDVICVLELTENRMTRVCFSKKKHKLHHRTSGRTFTGHCWKGHDFRAVHWALGREVGRFQQCYQCLWEEWSLADCFEHLDRESEQQKIGNCDRMDFFFS